VHFAFTEDQRLIRETARGFLEEKAGLEALRATIASDSGWSEALWAEMGSELGWMGLAIPEEFGGLGLGTVELAILMEEAGRVLLASPFYPTLGLVVPGILAAGTTDQKAALLPDIAAGTVRGAACLSGGLLPAPAGATATLVRDGAGFILSGEARYVAFGHAAELLLVVARAPGSRGAEGVSLVALPAATPGVTVERLTSLDLTRPLSHVRFEKVAVGADQVLGEAEAAGPALVRALDVGAALLAAEQVGGAEACLTFTVDYTKQRVQFGRTVGSFQALKHRMADMMVVVEAAKSAAYYAACAVDEVPAELAEAAAVARSYCSDAFAKCAGDAIQLHGGIGYTWEHHAHLYFKRARSAATLLGDATHYRERLAGIIGLDEPLAS
jgi:alkylation response protein AidB-like acyl-CoA dehydrogenase